MKIKDNLAILSVAFGTATLTVMLFGSALLNAGNEADPQAPKIPRPKLVLHGVELTLAAAEGRAFQAGDEPRFAWCAVNPSDDRVTVDFRMVMTGTALTDVLSRVMPMPSLLWEHPQTITLNPGETKTAVIDSHTKLPANVLVAVSLLAASPPQPPAGTTRPTIRPAIHSADPPSARVVFMEFATAAGKAQPYLASVPSSGRE